jgi:hypothetical protein
MVAQDDSLRVFAERQRVEQALCGDGPGLVGFAA